MRQSRQARQIIAEMLKDPEGEHYGLDLGRTTGLASGTLYPILFRMEREGWLSSAWERIDPRIEGRSPRKYYSLTPEGLSAVQAYLAVASLAV